MCAEGIRIGRRTDTYAASVSVSPVGDFTGLPRRPDRIAVTLVLIAWNTAVPGNVGSITTTIRGTQIPIGTVSPESPSWTGTVEQLGQLITGELGFRVAVAGQTLFMTEVFLDTDLTEAARK